MSMKRPIHRPHYDPPKEKISLRNLMRDANRLASLWRKQKQTPPKKSDLD